MRESCTSGSVRGARGNSRPYRNAAVPARTVALLLSACTILVQGPGTAVVATILHRRRPRSPANPGCMKSSMTASGSFGAARREQAAEHSLAYRERVPAKIVAVEFDQERSHEHIPVMASIADAVERRDPVFGPRSCSALSSARRNQAAASAWSNPHTGGNRFDKISKVIC